MKTGKDCFAASRRLRAALLTSSTLALAWMLPATPSHAQDATWLANPGSGDFNTGANWTPATVPTGTAFFGTSSTTSLSFSQGTVAAPTTVGGFTFNAGASNYTFTNDKAVLFNGAGIVINGGSVNLITTFNGQTAFTNTSSAGSATFTNNGGLFFEFASTAGNASITNNNTLGVIDNATLGNATVINNSQVYFFFGTGSGGTARLINTGASSLIDLSPDNTGLGVRTGSIEGAGQISLGFENLAVGGNNLSTTFSGVLRDGGVAGGFGGSLTKEGTGILTLSGNNIYTGTTTVSSGTLQAGIANAFSPYSKYTIATGAALDLNGFNQTIHGLTGDGSVINSGGAIPRLTLASGGTFAPGNGTPTSSMAIAGNLAFQSGAIYLVQVNPSTASFANITGTATLGGARVSAVFAAGSYVSKKYKILTATGGVSGTFASTVLNTNLPAAFHTALSYDANNVYLQILDLVIPGGLNRNQQAVGDALTNYFNANNGIPLVYGALSAGGLTQASGESATGAQQTTFQAMSQFLGLLTDPFMGRGSGFGGATSPTGYAEEGDQASAYAARKTNAFAMFTKAPLAKVYEPRWSVWVAGFGGSQSTSGNAVTGSNDTTSRIAGTAVGADYLLSPNTLVGFALAGGGTSFGVNTLGSGRSDLFQAGAYVRHTNGPAYITAALAYGWQDVTTNRTVSIAGLDQLRAEFNANAYSGRVEGGYRFVAPVIGGIGITPYAAGQFTTFDLPAYAESVVSGTGNFALNYASKSVTDARSELGFRTDKSFAMSNGVLTLRSRLAWAHDFDPSRAIATTFQALPGASFVVNGAAQASESALTTASAEMKWSNSWSAAATFEGEFSNVTQSYAGKGVVRYTW
ncbi:autotransporter outer membrane beta-barrel domain-containing protein [Bradyrhizobium sp. Cp5.3]|uniref:autotransporter family protein n=1 Tax=Bradyrhizobium sp. Cp5.3 TaxID=443598 RepID=UPI001FDA03D4|nr:autotransporter outer membrane beta-barrel domain-containing protein [Bradyrhizobium sp. Cp5.3]